MKGFVFLFAFLLGAASAAPAPYEAIVDNATMECSDFNRGDECYRCEIPEGWSSLGYGSSCPEGYTQVSAPGECTPSKNSRCCSQGHSGAMGDCGGMIVNYLTEECRFLQQGEGIPQGWEGMPSGGGSWQCPSGYKWPAEEGGAGICPIAVSLGAVMIFTLKQR